MRIGRGTDLSILGVAFLLTGIGVAMVYSATFVTAEYRFHSQFHFLTRHVIYALLGFAIMAGAWRFDYRLLANTNLAYGFMILATVSLILVFIPGLGVEVKGSHRWFRLGPITVQPLEIAKAALIVFLAHSITQKRGRIRRFSTGLLPHLLIPALPLCLVMMQPDFGGTAILGLLIIGMLFVGGARYTHLTVLSLFCAAASAAAIRYEPYRWRRLISFLDPWADCQGDGYQLCNSLSGFGDGGLRGMGLGQGQLKGFFVPELHTDFIFTNIAEEAGLIGVTIMLILFSVLVVQVVRISLRAGDEFGRMLSFGVGLMLAMQIVINIGVVMGALPTKGLTLPLVSYGGTSLMTTMFLIGIVLSVSRHGATHDVPAGADDSGAAFDWGPA